MERITTARAADTIDMPSRAEIQLGSQLRRVLDQIQAITVDMRHEPQARERWKLACTRDRLKDKERDLRMRLEAHATSHA